MIRIFTNTTTENIVEHWSQFSNKESALTISKEFQERAFDGSTFFNVLEISTSFVVGVGSGMFANWLGKILSERKANKLKIGRTTYNIPSDDEIVKAEIIMALKSEIEELKRKSSEN